MKKDRQMAIDKDARVQKSLEALQVRVELLRRLRLNACESERGNRSRVQK